MAKYILTNEAKNDLIKIWQYTFDTWGEKQADHYLDLLEFGCENLPFKQEIWKPFQDIHPCLYSLRCEHHYLFFLQKEKEIPMIIAFLHEKMDLLSRLKDRV